MVLEHGLEGTSAVYNIHTNTYDIQQRPQYRWITVNNTVMSPWSTDIEHALQWIKQYDQQSLVVDVSALNEPGCVVRVGHAKRI